MRNILAALLTVALCLGLAACGPAPEPEPTPTPTPSVSPSPEAAEFALACYPEAGFHPITGSNRTNLALGGLLYEGLFALNGQFQPQEALCASASVSADGLQWSFIPRSGVTFSDGSPLTAAEIAASLNLTRTSPLYSARFAGVTDIAAANGMVTVTLSRANGALPALLDIPIVKETGGVPLGTGPYVLAGTGENLALEARSGWWQGKALPRDTNYLHLEGLRLEAREKLDEIRPLNLGQASRISGVSPADVAALMIFLEKSGKTASEEQN